MPRIPPLTSPTPAPSAATRQTITAPGTFSVAATDSVIAITAAAVGIVTGTLPDAYPSAPILILNRKSDATEANRIVRFSRTGVSVEGDAFLDLGPGDTTIARAADGVWYATAGSGGGSTAGGTTSATPVLSKTASYTVAPADFAGGINLIVEVTSPSATDLTLPTGIPAGSMVELVALDTGMASFAPGSGVTFRQSASLTTRTKNSSIFARARSASEWIISGDLA